MDHNQIVENLLKTELGKINISTSILKNIANQSHEDILDKFRNNTLTDDELVKFLSKLYHHIYKLESSVRMINIISN